MIFFHVDKNYLEHFTKTTKGAVRILLRLLYLPAAENMIDSEKS